MSIGFWQIVIVVLIVLLVFGGKRIANLGSDLGKALKGFKKEVKEDDTDRIPKSYLSQCAILFIKPNNLVSFIQGITKFFLRFRANVENIKEEAEKT